MEIRKVKPLRAPSFKLKKSAIAKVAADDQLLVQITQRVVVFDIAQRKTIFDLKVMNNEWHVAISDQSKILAVKNESGEITFYDIENQKVISQKSNNGYRDTGCCPIFTKEGDALIDGSWDGYLRVLSVHDASIIKSFDEYYGYMVTNIICAKNIDRYFVVFRRKGNDPLCKIATFVGTHFETLEYVAPPAEQVAAEDGWVYIEHISIDANGKYLAVAIKSDNDQKKNSILTMNLENNTFSIAELPSHLHYVRGLATNTYGLTVASVHDNLATQEMSFSEIAEFIKNVEHTYLYFYNNETMEELCKWYWDEPWMLSFSNNRPSLAIASIDEQGAYIAHTDFTLENADALRNHERTVK